MYSSFVLASALLLLHLVSFAAYLGAGFAQLQLMKSSRRVDLDANVRADRESLAAAIVTRIELPAIFGSVLTGMSFIMQNPALMKFGWLHGKLFCVLLLALLSHAEMFNARAIVQIRADKGDAGSDEIDARKKRHALFGAVGAILVVVVLILVTFVRLGA